MSLTKVSYSMITGAVVNALDFGADPTGTNDSTTAIQAAIDSLNSQFNPVPNAVPTGGGTVELPVGTYKVSRINVKANVQLLGQGIYATTVVPTTPNIAAIQITGDNAYVSGLAVRNIDNVAGVTGVKFAPIDEGSHDITSINFSTLCNVEIKDCAYGVVMRPGAATAAPPWNDGGDANCFHNRVFNVSIRDTYVGVYLQAAIDSGYGSNRNYFADVRIGGAGGNGTNTGILIDAGDTTKFIACSFEGIQAGASPIAIKINGGGFFSFYNPVFEACPRRIDSAITEYYLYSPVGLNKDVLNALPNTWIEDDTLYIPDAITQVNSAYAANQLGAGPVAANTRFRLESRSNDGKTLGTLSEVFGISSNNTDATRLQMTAALGNIINTPWCGFQVEEKGVGGRDLVLQYAGGAVRPGQDNGSWFGVSSNRWAEIYCANPVINTSDKREKQQIRDLSDAECRVAVKLKSSIRAFKWNDSVAKKGDDARIHFGVIAQEVQQAFASEGLDAARYGLFCYDEWNATEALVNEDGEIAIPARPAGNRLGVRYDQLWAFIISAL